MPDLQPYAGETPEEFALRLRMWREAGKPGAAPYYVSLISGGTPAGRLRVERGTNPDDALRVFEGQRRRVQTDRAQRVLPAKFRGFLGMGHEPRDLERRWYANEDARAREREYARWLRALGDDDINGLRSGRDELQALLDRGY